MSETSAEFPVVLEACRAVLGGGKSIEKVADEYTYASLPLCVIDSVFSIGVRYEGVRNVLERYCAFAGVPRLSPTRTVPPRAQQQSITAFLQLAIAFDAERLAVEVFGNRQRTSARSGILKADAVVRFAGVLARHRIECLQDVLESQGLASVERDVRTIPGQSSGLSWRYFLMLAGREDLVKPDRMILRFLERTLRRSVSPDEAQALLRAAADALGREFPGLTARTLDNLIWAEERSRPSAGRGAGAVGGGF
ncbi:MAG: hypothetical protein NTV21_04185 [Planctomycetota bacterium]|nr:hypothetical protein [Planctomycetota bacterium]